MKDEKQETARPEGEWCQRIMGSKHHRGHTFFFEHKTTLPNVNFSLKNSQQIINFYTKRIHESKDKIELAKNFHLRGCVYFDLENYESSRLDFEDSLLYNELDALVYADLSDVYSIFQRHEDALIMSQKSIQLNPKYHIVYIALATSLMDIEKFDEAIESCKKAIQIYPNYIDAYYQMAYIYRYFKLDESSAFDFYSKGIDIGTKYKNNGVALSVCFRRRGNMYYKKNLVDECLNDYNSAIEHNSEDFLNWYDRGYCYFRSSNYENAIEDFTNAIEKMKSDEVDPWVFYWRAKSYFLLEQYEKCIEDCQIVLDISPDNDFFHYLIGTAYKLIESNSQALYHYDIAVKMNQEWLRNGYVKLLYSELGHL
eukprot:gene4891-8485_t